MGTEYLDSLKVSSHRLIINLKSKNGNFTLGKKQADTTLNQVPTNSGTNWHRVLPDKKA